VQLTRKFFASLLILSAIQTVNAGTALTIQTTSETAKGPNKQTFYVHEGKVRLSTNSKDPNGQYLIFQSKEKQIVAVNTTHKSYSVLDPTYIKKAQTASSQAMTQAQQQMEARIKSMPPEQQERMRQMMSKMMNGDPSAEPSAAKKTYKNVNKTENVNGINCEVFESYKDEQKVGEVCVANYQQLNIDKVDFDTINQFFTFFKDMANQFSQGSNDNFDAMFIDQGQLPVKSTEFKAGKKVSSSIVSLDKSVPVTATLFEIPADFSKKEMPSLPPSGMAQ